MQPPTPPPASKPPPRGGRGQPEPPQPPKSTEEEEHLQTHKIRTRAEEGEGSNQHSSSKPRRGDGQAAVGPAERRRPAGRANVTRGRLHELPSREGRRASVQGLLWERRLEQDREGWGMLQGRTTRAPLQGALVPSGKASRSPRNRKLLRRKIQIFY